MRQIHPRTDDINALAVFYSASRARVELYLDEGRRSQAGRESEDS